MIKFLASPRFRSIVLLFFSVAVLGLTAVSPIFEGRLDAAPENAENGINIPRNRLYDKNDETSMALQTCEAHLVQTTITRSLIENHLIKDDTDSLGYNFEEQLRFDFGDYLPGLINTHATIIEFRAPGPDDIGGIINGPYNGRDRSQADRNTICANTKLVPVTNNQWKGVLFTVGEDGELEEDVLITFTYNDTGPSSEPNSYFHIEYYDTSSGDCNIPDVATGNNNCVKTKSDFVVQGRPRAPGHERPVSTNLSFSGNWVDVSTITAERSIPGAPNYATSTETYVMGQWRAYEVCTTESVPCSDSDKKAWSIYFLSETEDPQRRSQTIDTGKSCEHPMRARDNDKHPTFTNCSPSAGSQQCTPFIVVTEQINISKVEDSSSNTSGRVANIDGSGESFRERVNKIGNANAYLYDFDTDCSYLGHSKETKLGSQDRSKVWFYHSEQNKAIVNVFPQGAGNEAPYIGQYNEISRTPSSGPDTSNTITFQGGANCNAEADLLGERSLRTTNWSIWDPASCSAQGAARGSVSVLTVTGQAGEDGFTEITGRAAAIEVETSEQLQELSCVENSALDWFLCPVLNAAIAAAEGLDSVINSLLDIDEGQLFGSSDTAVAYHDAWGVFRTFALVLIAAAALIMVIGQAAGLEILDAYTIRKVLPRLIIATIGITISWEILEFLVGMSNDLGSGIRSIIYAPFSGENGFNFTVGFAGWLAGVGIVGAGLVLGQVLFPVVLSLMLSGALGALLAVLLLVFREIAVIFLVIVSPIAIACAILPNTKKVWDLWRAGITGMLMAYLIISAIFAVTKVFAVTSAGGGLLPDIIALISWFAGYFLILGAIQAAFRFAGFIGNIAGVARDRSRGVFERLGKGRQASVGNRMQQLKQDSTGQYNPAARLVGGMMRRAAPGSGGFVPTRGGQARYRSSVQSMALQAADESLKRDNGRAAFDDEANEIAATATNRDDFIKGMEGMGKTRAQALQSLGMLENGYGVSVGSKQARLVAAKALAQSPTAFKPDDFNTTMSKIAAIDRQLVNDGTVTTEDAAAMWKGAQARPDIAKISFGEHVKLANDAVSGRGPNLDALRNSFVENADPATMRLRPEAVSHYNEIMGTRIQSHINRIGAGEKAGETDLKKDLARVANMYDAFSQAGSSNTQIMAEGVFTQQVPLTDKDGTAQNVTVQKAIEALRGDETFQQLRREYRSEIAGQGGQDNQGDQK